MLIPKTILPDLAWWIKKLPVTKNWIKTADFQMEIYTDASGTGWGATNGFDNIYGFWDDNQKEFHINYKELLAVKLALESLANHLSNCQLLLRIDNTTAISYMNRMGGVRFVAYNKLAKKIWQWAEDRKIFLFASYIASADNKQADSLSRIKNDNIEWELGNLAFDMIVKQFGRPTIDLFACKRNAKKCKEFVSWKSYSEALQIDAFTIKWTNLSFYAFPPFGLVLRTLVKIKQDRASGIIVVPNWPSQSWYPLFLDLLVGDPIIFQPDVNLLLSPCRKKPHPQAKHLYLMAGRVSAELF